MAAVAHYAQYGNSQALRAVSAQLDPDGPGRADAKMIRVLSQTLPEFKKFQAQVARGAERAKDMDLGSSKDRDWRQTRHDMPQVSDGRRATGPAGTLTARRGVVACQRLHGCLGRNKDHRQGRVDPA